MVLLRFSFSRITIGKVLKSFQTVKKRKGHSFALFDRPAWLWSSWWEVRRGRAWGAQGRGRGAGWPRAQTEGLGTTAT